MASSILSVSAPKDVVIDGNLSKFVCHIRLKAPAAQNLTVVLRLLDSTGAPLEARSVQIIGSSRVIPKLATGKLFKMRGTNRITVDKFYIEAAILGEADKKQSRAIDVYFPA